MTYWLARTQANRRTVLLYFDPIDSLELRGSSNQTQAVHVVVQGWAYDGCVRFVSLYRGCFAIEELGQCTYQFLLSRGSLGRLTRSAHSCDRGARMSCPVWYRVASSRGWTFTCRLDSHTLTSSESSFDPALRRPDLRLRRACALDATGSKSSWRSPLGRRPQRSLLRTGMTPTASCIV